MQQKKYRLVTKDTWQCVDLIQIPKLLPNIYFSIKKKIEWWMTLRISWIPWKRVDFARILCEIDQDHPLRCKLCVPDILYVQFSFHKWILQILIQMSMSINYKQLISSLNFLSLKILFFQWLFSFFSFCYGQSHYCQQAITI